MAVATLLTNYDLSPYARIVVQTVKGIFDIKKLLKGESAKHVEKIEGNKIQVKNNYGEITTVNAASGIVLINPRIDRLVTGISGYVHEHNSKGGFRLLTEDGDLLCSPDDIKGIATPLPITEETLCKKITTDANLVIKKPDLIGRSTWDFYYRQHLISTKIEDEEWQNKVYKGDIAIRAGDYIKATLEISIDIDLQGKPIPESEKYIVKKVHGDVWHEDFEQLNF